MGKRRSRTERCTAHCGCTGGVFVAASVFAVIGGLMAVVVLSCTAAASLFRRDSSSQNLPVRDGLAPPSTSALTPVASPLEEHASQKGKGRNTNGGASQKEAVRDSLASSRAAPTAAVSRGAVIQGVAQPAVSHKRKSVPDWKGTGKDKYKMWLNEAEKDGRMAMVRSLFPKKTAWKGKQILLVGDSTVFAMSLILRRATTHIKRLRVRYVKDWGCRPDASNANLTAYLAAKPAAVVWNYGLHLLHFHPHRKFERCCPAYEDNVRESAQFFAQRTASKTALVWRTTNSMCDRQ
eukprot:TRINITY_DN15683_c0_g1_i4.p1 TRINITY_DN15683_c0_g1~~TRINITY_DN15683_c0_g1_i4.p1  ORF type:complete len:293 (+),score=28.68 TRINITY_DN15683_c0_g1_i4:252-1130(+)